MTKEQKEQFLNGLAQYIVEEFEEYGIIFNNYKITPIITTSIYYVLIKVKVNDFNDEITDKDRIIFEKFIFDITNDYIKSSTYKNKVEPYGRGTVVVRGISDNGKTRVDSLNQAHFIQFEIFVKFDT